MTGASRSLQRHCGTRRLLELVELRRRVGSDVRPNILASDSSCGGNKPDHVRVPIRFAEIDQGADVDATRQVVSGGRNKFRLFTGTCLEEGCFGETAQ